MISSAHESLKQNRSHSFSLSPLNTQFGECISIKPLPEKCHCISKCNQDRVVSNMSWKRGCSSLQLLLNYQRVLHAIPIHISSWLSCSLTVFNWKRESVHFWASSWSALIIECVDVMWNLAKGTLLIPPFLFVSVSLAFCLSAWLSIFLSVICLEVSLIFWSGLIWN